MLPFTADVLFSGFEQYNRAIWPAQVVAYALGLAALALTFRPVAGGSRLIAMVLAAAWLWTGVAWHLLHFATINFAAPAFAALSVGQGLLLAWRGAARGRIAFRFRGGVFGWVGLAFAGFAMTLHPLVEWLAGHGWPSSTLFGVAPGPTTIYTLGVLLLVDGRTPLHLMAIPVLWSFIGGIMAWWLNTPEALALPLAGGGGLWLVLRKNRRGGVLD